MKTIKMYIQLFIWFLKAHGVLIPFIVNLSKEDKRPLFTYLKQIRSRIWVDIAFCWTYSLEGHTFWNTLDDQWRILYKFFSFLNEHGALKQYISCIQIQKGIDNIFLKLLNDGIAHNLISTTFQWHGTPEGFDYWLDLSNKWKEQLKDETRSTPLTLSIRSAHTV